MRRLIGIALLGLLLTPFNTAKAVVVEPPPCDDIQETYENLKPQYPQDSQEYEDNQVNFIINHFFEYSRVIPENNLDKTSLKSGITDWFFYRKSNFFGKDVTFEDFVQNEKQLEWEIPQELFPAWSDYDQSLSRKKTRIIFPFYGEVCLFQPNSEEQKAIRPRLYYSFLVKSQIVRTGVLKLLELRIAEEERELFEFKKLVQELCGQESYYPVGKTPTVVDDKGTLLHTDKNISRSSCLGAGGFGALSSVLGTVTDALGSVLENVAPLSAVDAFVSNLDPSTLIEKTSEFVQQNLDTFTNYLTDKIQNLSPDKLKDFAIELAKEKFGDEFEKYKNIIENMTPEQLQNFIESTATELAKGNFDQVLQAMPQEMKDQILNGDLLKQYLNLNNITSFEDLMQTLNPQELINATLNKITQDVNFFTAMLKDQLSKYSPDKLKEIALEIVKKRMGVNADISYYEELYSKLSPEELEEVIRDQIYEYAKEYGDVSQIIPTDLLNQITSGEVFQEYLKKTAFEYALEKNPAVQAIKDNISSLFKDYLYYYRYLGKYDIGGQEYYEMTKCLRDNDNPFATSYYSSSYSTSSNLFYSTSSYVEKIKETLCSLVQQVGKETAQKLFEAAKTYAYNNTFGRVSITPDGQIKIQNIFETASIGLENLVFDQNSIDNIIDSVVDTYFAKKFGIMPDSLSGLMSLSQKDFDYVKDILDDDVGNTIKRFYGGFPSYRKDTVLYYKPITSRIQYFGREYSKEQGKERADYCTLLVTRLENIGQEIRTQKRLLYNLTKKYAELTAQERNLLKGSVR